MFGFSVRLCLFTTVLFSAGVLFFMEPLLTVLGAGEDTFAFARDYAFCVIVCGGLPTVLSNTLSTLLRSVGESKKAGFGITMGGVINIGLDPLFMFVLLPDGYEIVGAGAATCLSNCISCAYFIVVLARLGGDSVLRMGKFTAFPEKKSIAGIFSVGVPSSITTLLFDLDYVVIDRLMSGYGDLSLAAIGIVLKVERLPLNVGVGLCQGMLPIVAYNYSAKNYRRMNEARRYSCMLGLICAAISITLYELFAGPIMQFFIDDAETVALGTGFLRVRCLATPLMFLSFFHVHLFNAFGCGRHALFLGVARWLVFNIPMLFLLNAIIGRSGIVWSQVTADILTVTLSVIVYRHYERRCLSDTVGA